MRRFVLPVLILCLFVFESMSMDLFNLRTFNEEWIIVPRFILIVIILCTIYTGPFLGMVYGMVFGFLYDIVYTDILGVYFFAFAIVAYFVSKIMKVIHANIFVAFFMILFAIAIVEYLVYGVHFLIGTTTMLHGEFLTTRLLPTLGFNGIVAILFFFPIKVFMERLAVEQNEDL